MGYTKTQLVLALLMTSMICIQILLSTLLGSSIARKSVELEHLLGAVGTSETYSHIHHDESLTNFTFFGLPLTAPLSNQELQSTVHCVGENFLNSTWMHKSCHVSDFCYAIHKQQYVLVNPAATGVQFQSAYWRRSTSPYQAVSTSILSPTLMRKKTYKWFPTVVQGDVGSIYHLPLNTLWIPLDFHLDPQRLPLSRLLFDYVLPVYNLISMFGLEDKRLLLTTTQPNMTLIDALSYFLPTVVAAADQDLSRQPLPNDAALICSHHAVFGIGALTDHGTKQGHGERLLDYQTARNVGRGPLFWKLREYILKQHPAIEQRRQLAPPYRLLHVGSATERRQYPVNSLNDVRVKEWDPYQQSLDATLRITTTSQFYMSFAGESAIPALFLPRGATLIVLFDEADTVPGKHRPILHDWDVWNHMSHLRVHWLPQTQNDESLVLLKQIIETELEYLATMQLKPPPSATVNVDAPIQGLSLQYSDRPQVSHVHCVGENFVKYSSFLYRSCEVNDLCLHLGSRVFVTSPTEAQLRLDQAFDNRNQEYATISTVTKTGVLEGRNARLARNETPWFPQIAETATDGALLELSSDVVWMPFRGEPQNMKNPGHLLWDFFLPEFKLLAMYGWEGKRPLLTLLDDSCLQLDSCKQFLFKFLPLMGQGSIQSVYDKDLVAGRLNVSRICARKAAVGIGMLTDHGFSRHGQNRDDYAKLFNAGHGPALWDFRNFMLRNMALLESNPRYNSRHRIILSINSSNKVTRRKGFAAQLRKLMLFLPEQSVEIQAVDMAKLSLRQQIDLMLSTTIFVTVVGGSSAIATFLPRGANLVLYFDDVDEFVGRSKQADFPAMMDFDVWNSASYLKVHWLPISTMEEHDALDSLALLVKQELHSIDKANDRTHKT